VAGFFVSRYGQIVERIFITGFQYLPLSKQTYSYQKEIEINVPFYISNNDSQIIIRIYYQSFSSIGRELNDEILTNIKNGLKDKPEGLRIDNLSVNFSDNLFSKFDRVESTSIGTVNYEDMPLVPSQSLDSQQFWFASPDEKAFRQYLPVGNQDFELSGAVYSPTWIVNLPENMEADIRVNPILQPSNSIYYKQLGFRTLASDPRITSDEKISAAEGKDGKVVVAKNANSTDTKNENANAVQAQAVYNQINQFRLPNNTDRNDVDFLEGLVTGDNDQILEGKDPDIVLSANDDKFYLLTNSSDVDANYNKASVSIEGLFNQWKSPDGRGSFDQNSLLQVTKGITKPSFAFDEKRKMFYIVGFSSPGSVLLKTVDLNNTGIFDKIDDQGRTVYKIISYNFLIDGQNPVLSDEDQVLVTPDDLSGVTALETFTSIAIDEEGQCIIAYVPADNNKCVYARLIKAGSKQMSKSIKIVDMGQLGGDTNLNVYCPVMKYYNNKFYLLFWCSSKIFMTSSYSLPFSLSESEISQNPIYLVAGNSDFTDKTNPAHPYFLRLQQEGKLYLYSLDEISDLSNLSEEELQLLNNNKKELDVKMQAAGLVVSKNPVSASQIFVYYKINSGELSRKPISPGGHVGVAEKLENITD
jgi:hypothetical protein